MLLKCSIKIYIYIYLSVPSLSCGIWDLVPQPRIEPMTPALGAQSDRNELMTVEQVLEPSKEIGSLLM